MRLTRLVVACAITAMLIAATYAQDSPPNYLRQPASAQRTAYEFDNYLYFGTAENGSATAGDQKSPSSPAQNPAETVPAANGSGTSADASNGSDTGAGKSSTPRHWTLGIRDCDLGDPWTLPQPCLLSEHRITVGGWMEAGAYTNQYDQDFNGPIALRPNKFFNLDQLDGYAERLVKQEDGKWDWGGRVDYMFGVDAPFTQAFGDHTWDFGWNSSSFGGQPLYGSAVPQAYADVAYGQFKVRAGHFYTPIGYEVVPAIGGFFYSHPYAFSFGQPFTHTGVLASDNVNEKLTVYGGWVDGWDGGFENADHASMFLGGLTYKFNDRTNVAWYMTWGDNGNGQAFAGASQGELFENCFVLTHQITKRWTYVFECDYADNYDLPGGDTFWYGIDQYLFYKISNCWGFGGRFEWFRDNDGVRVIAGNAGSYFEMTAGVNWKPHANVVVRPELRYDWYDGAIGPNGAPFNNHSSTSQLSGGCDVIFTF